MKWLVRRVLRVWLVLVAVCTGGALAGRLDPAPNRLETLGFGLCDGEACYNHIKLGIDWRTVLDLFPDAFPTSASLEHHIDAGKIRSILLSNVDSDVLQFITIVRADLYNPRLLSTTAGDIVAQYGAPCRVVLKGTDGTRNMMLLIYPTLTVHVWVVIRDQDNRASYWLLPDSPVWNVWIMRAKEYGTCSDPTQEDRGAWHGFTSRDIYLARYARVLATRRS
jgi:hypothetical protein